MDYNRFDDLTRSLSSGASRRRLLSSLVGGMVATVATGRAESAKTLAKKKGNSNRATAENQLNIGERCDPRKEIHGERHGGNKCRTGFSVSYTNTKGKTVCKCACKPPEQPANSNQSFQCCSGLSDGRQCVDPSGTAAAAPPPPPPGPPGPPGPTGPPGPPGPPPPPVPEPFAGTCTVGQDFCYQGVVANCNANPSCFCYTTTSGARFCGTVPGVATPCDSDADCTTVTGPNSACVQGGPNPITCVPRQCNAPCPP
jgi:hypothetical protein